MGKSNKENNRLEPTRSEIRGARKNWTAYALLFIALAGGLAYANTLDAPLIFSDRINIESNMSLRSLKTAFSVPSDSGLAGRPFVNFTFAVNYALGGGKVAGYHLVNILIHILSAFALFGIVRRTLRTEPLRDDYGRGAAYLAFAAAVIWMLHPIQTQAVTYLSQRCESLMGLLFLLTFYCAVRGFQSDSPFRWHLASVIFFFMGVGSKEVIAVAPPLILLYEILFVRRSFRDAVRRSWPLYGGFFIGLMILAFLVTTAASAVHNQGLREGFATLFPYWGTQSIVLLHYVRLIVWPAGFCFDYGWPPASAGEVILPAAIILLVIAASAWAAWRRHPIGYLGLWFFVIAAPSSLAPLLDAANEYRMYLSSAAPVVLTVLACYRWGCRMAVRLNGRFEKPSTVFPRIGMAAVLAVAFVLGVLTFQRNNVYRTEENLWKDTVGKAPANSRAHLNLALVYDRAGRLAAAINEYDTVLKLKPDDVTAHADLGYALARSGRVRDGIAHLRRALELRPDYVEAHANLGIALFELGQAQEAIEHFKKAVALKPDRASSYLNLGMAYLRSERPGDAVVYLKQAVALQPGNAEAHANLGLALDKVGRRDEAGKSLEDAVRLQPGSGLARQIQEYLRNSRR
jgi:protein O-mannosyl-transferase